MASEALAGRSGRVPSCLQPSPSLARMRSRRTLKSRPISHHLPKTGQAIVRPTKFP